MNPTLPTMKDLTTSSKDVFQERLMNERAIEFVYEEQRWWDVIRYKKGDEIFNKPIYGVRIYRTSTTPLTFQITRRKIENRVFSDYMHVYQAVVFQLVDLNVADTTSLKTLKGIGSAIAKRIVDYRRRLGGFARNEQLLEVYGVDSSKYSLLQNQLKSPSRWTKICINTADVEILKRHPYISPYEARNIVYFRTKRGPIRNLQQFVSDRIISKSTSEKLGEYVDYSN